MNMRIVMEAKKKTQWLQEFDRLHSRSLFLWIGTIKFSILPISLVICVHFNAFFFTSSSPYFYYHMQHIVRYII